MPTQNHTYHLAAPAPPLTALYPLHPKPYTLKSFAMSYEYDSWNRIQYMIYPDGEKVSYGYDRGGMLNSITGDQNGSSYKYLDSILYNEFEQKDVVYYGNGTKAFYKYDILRRLVWLYSQTSANEPMQSIDYSYDAVSNIVSIDNTAGMLSNGLGGKYQNIYTYDDLYRLEQAKGNWFGNNPVGYNLEMRYMPNGRIVEKYLDADTYRQTPFSSNQFPVHYHNDYHYTNNGQPNTLTHIANGTIQDFNWDVKGNLVFHHRNEEPLNRSFCWDDQNRLQGVKDDKFLSYYLYDANGDRVYKLTGKLAAQNINGNWQYYHYMDRPTLYASPYVVTNRKGYTKHYYAENERIVSKIGGGGLYDIDRNDNPEMFVTHKERSIKLFAEVMECLETQAEVPESLLKFLYEWKDIRDKEKDYYWYHPDHLGSSSWITYSDGSAVEHLHYMPWGEDFVRQRSTDWHAMYTFSAKEKDTETGYSYFGSRYYSSDLSIWLSVDPMASKYPSLSPYVYCANNPVKLVDPNGEEVEYNSFEDRLITFFARVLSSDFRQKFKVLKQSEETYVFNKNNGGINNFTTDGEKLFINYSINEQSRSEGQTIFSNLRHETTHGIQFEYGEIGFELRSLGWGILDRNDNYFETQVWQPINYDLTDEYEAHTNQNLGFRMKNDPNSSQSQWNKASESERYNALSRTSAYRSLNKVSQNNTNTERIKNGKTYARPYSHK